MKTNYWLIFGAMLSTSLLAQTVTNAPSPAIIETPAPAAAVTNLPPAPPAPVVAPVVAPETKAATKPAVAKKKAAPAKKKVTYLLKTIPLKPGPATVEATRVNVRGQPRLTGEVLTRLDKGQSVTVIEEIVRNNSGPEEPSAWAKINLPSTQHVWVNTSYIDATNKTVLPKKLNLRGGPGENFSILGRLNRGDSVKEISTKGAWMEIEPPSTAYGFVAAQYLKQEPAVVEPIAVVPAPVVIPAVTPAPVVIPEVTPTPATVTEPPTIATIGTEQPGMRFEPAPTPAVIIPAPVEPGIVAPAIEEPLPPRIVSHEGVVRGMTSIQAPSHFALVSPETGKVINYLHTSSKELDLRRYKGMRIVVTGEEGLDERWLNTPIITIQKIVVVE